MRVSWPLVCVSVVFGFSLACGSGEEAAAPSPSPSPVNGISGTGTKDDPYILACDTKARDLGSTDWSSIFIKCPASCSSGSVWGTCDYTFDSSVCRAAIHAGAISAGKGGMTRADHKPGRDKYEGSTLNGITSSSWGSYGETLTFGRMDAAPCKRR